MDTPDLFNVGRKKKRAPRPKSEYATQIKHLMLYVYTVLYSKKMREKPHLQPRHWSQLRNLVDRYGPVLVEERLRLFFASQDRWIRETSGYTIGAFISQWQRLAAESNQRKSIQTPGGQPQSPCLHQPTCESPIEHSRKIVDDLKGAYRNNTPQTSSASFHTTSMPNDPF
jgi:hypothetical protein